MKYCPNCGKEIVAGASFCDNCGAKLGGENQASYSNYSTSILPNRNIAISVILSLVTCGIYNIYWLQKYIFFLKKSMIHARICHFSCKIIDFLVNFQYFLLYLHIEKTKTTCQLIFLATIDCFLQTMKIGCTISLYFCT